MKEITIQKVESQYLKEQIFKLREWVFVDEQKVDKRDEFDQYENTSKHFAALDSNQKVVGTARWRKTEKGIKLERFAIDKNHRQKGIGKQILLAMLADIKKTQNKNLPIYLHAQSQVVAFYQKNGFEVRGEEFEECNIKHFMMVKQTIE